MSAPPASAFPPVAVQVKEIGIGLNAGLFLTFLMGIYTTVYFGTMYLYVTRKASQATIVTSTITMLYLLNIGQLAIQWQLLQSSFVDNGETRETIYLTTFLNPAWATLASQILTAATNILADGLLIWRCFYAWDRSLLAISLPCFFLVAETGIYLSFILFFSAVKLNPSISQGTILNDLISSGYFSSFSSTMSATLLIAYRIYYSLSNQDDHSKKRFTHVVDVLIQSAAAYSLALMVAAINGVVLITSGDLPNVSVFAVLNYEASALLFFVSGIAPTIMVARVALADNTEANVHISGLQFQGQSKADSDINGGMDSTVVIGYSTGSRESEKQRV